MSHATLFTTLSTHRGCPRWQAMFFPVYLQCVCGSNRVTDSVLMGSEMNNKALRSGETARADTKLTDKGQTDRFHTLTEGRTSCKAAGSRDPQMDTGEELLYIRAGGKFEFSTKSVTFENVIFHPKWRKYTIICLLLGNSFYHPRGNWLQTAKRNRHQRQRATYKSWQPCSYHFTQHIAPHLVDV